VRGGVAHICAVMNDGSVQCFGNNDYGQLGDGTTTRRTEPVVVSGFSATNLDDWKCCVAHQSTASLGCAAGPVQQCVCDQRPSCCTSNWDATCASLATSSNCWNPGLCGNGVKEPGEDCDDGNINPGDGCGYTCLSEASACVPRLTPGVADRAIRQCVCFGAGNDPFCCNNHWDSLCVSGAINTCGAQCGSPCTPHSTPGSSNPNTTMCVCNAPVNDPFCCNFNWDGICVAEAQQSCGLICVD
jgi:cysteine-rich repeat protein